MPAKQKLDSEKVADPAKAKKTSLSKNKQPAKANHAKQDQAVTVETKSKVKPMEKGVVAKEEGKQATKADLKKLQEMQNEIQQVNIPDLINLQALDQNDQSVEDENNSAIEIDENIADGPEEIAAPSQLINPDGGSRLDASKAS